MRGPDILGGLVTVLHHHPVVEHLPTLGDRGREEVGWQSERVNTQEIFLNIALLDATCISVLQPF